MVISYLDGQFGNNLFQIVCAKYFADLHNDNFKIYIDNHAEQNYNTIYKYWNFFKLFENNIINHDEYETICNTKKEYIKFYIESPENRRKYIDDIKFINKDYIYIIKGNRQSVKYWNNDIDFVKSIFNYNIVLPQLPFNIKNSIGIHLRYIFSGICKNFIEKQLLNLFNSTNDDFCLFCDKFSKLKLKFPDVFDKINNFNNVHIIHYEPLIDFKLLSLCKIKIITCSTFAWWASYLSNTKTYMIKSAYERYKIAYESDLKLNNFEII